MLSQYSPYLAAAILFGLSTFVGLIPIHLMVQRREAQHELRIGSASYLRRMGGWTLVASWLFCVMFVSTVIGDWIMTGDMEAATARGWLRLGKLINLIATLGGFR